MTSEQKQNELFYLNKFLALLGKVPKEIQSGESPDFIVILEQKKIGIECTEFHSDLKGETGRPRRAIEETWLLLQRTIMKEVGKCNELKETYGFLFFKKLELPPKSKHGEFTSELIKLSLEMINSGYKQIKPGGNYPFLNKYLEKFCLERVGYYSTWNWNYDASLIGVTEEELIDAVKSKIEKVVTYKQKNIGELWLLIISGHRLSQTMPPPPFLEHQLNDFGQLNELLKASGYTKVYLYQYIFDTIYEWPGWAKFGKEDFSRCTIYR